MNIPLFKKLCEATGAPAFEYEIRQIIIDEMAPLADDVWVDNVGDVIALIKGKSSDERIMCAAHMDEIGFIVRHIDNDGFIRILPLGGFDPKTLTAQRVVVHGKKDLPGCMGVKPIHVMTPDERTKMPAITDYVVDVGMTKEEVEKFLRMEEIPYCVGYGATECGPLIAYTHWMDIKPGSCGKPCSHIEVEIDSVDPVNIPGEILVRGLNVMLGYYKADELTKKTIDEDGWYHTGDLGVMDEDKFIFIKGRCKTMILGPSGQNIYPEELEDKLNNMPLVNESIVVQREQKLVGLVYPDYDEAKNLGLNKNDIMEVMEQNRLKLNEDLPVYSKVTKMELQSKEFEKTAKRSIKRFLYK